LAKLFFITLLASAPITFRYLNPDRVHFCARRSKNIAVTLETPRILLRQFSTNDLDALAALMSDAQFMRFSTGPYSREQTEAFLERIFAGYRDQLPSQFALIHRADKKLIGYCGFFRQIVDNIEEVEIGYRLDSGYWGRGLATEAARVVRDHAFNDLNLGHVVSLIHPGNTASRRVAEKNGMTAEKETTFRGLPAIVFGIRRPTATRDAA
jgi:[ribosomal protein S5]-alanine N-acetyltransferase